MDDAWRFMRHVIPGLMISVQLLLINFLVNGFHLNLMKIDK